MLFYFLVIILWYSSCFLYMKICLLMILNIRINLGFYFILFRFLEENNIGNIICNILYSVIFIFLKYYKEINVLKFINVVIIIIFYS